MTAESRKLCALEELPEGGCRGFSVHTSSGHEDIFLVHKNARIVAYRNSCPHTGVPLDWVPDQFLNLDGDLIQCSTHHALFRIEDGFCVSGPCAGQSLTVCPLRIDSGGVFLESN